MTEDECYAWSPPAGVDINSLSDADWTRDRAIANFATDDLVRAFEMAERIEKVVADNRELRTECENCVATY